MIRSEYTANLLLAAGSYCPLPKLDRLITRQRRAQRPTIWQRIARWFV